MLLGEGDFRYEEAVGWEQIPNGWTHGDVAGIASTTDGERVYIFNRGEHPVLVYNRDGSFNTHWGEGVFTRPHGITIVGDVIYLADDGDHTVRKFTLDGQLLQTLGTANQPSATGYDSKAEGNLRTIKSRRAVQPADPPLSSAQRRLLRLRRLRQLSRAPLPRRWQAAQVVGPDRHGAGPVQPAPQRLGAHDGRVFVCDRENDRVQIFSPTGEFLSNGPSAAPAISTSTRTGTSTSARCTTRPASCRWRATSGTATCRRR